MRCVTCGFLSSSLQPQINVSGIELDESKRETALYDLRRRNFEMILDILANAGLQPSTRILEIGCGHGWFLEAARARNYQAIGVEPDEPIAAIAKANGQEVRVGYFPDTVGAAERFDAIIFNDVFEHLSDPWGALRQVERYLAPGGMVVINLPLATGIFYTLANALDGIGLRGPFLRMWQYGFPSPHRSYFSADQLAALAHRCGLGERARHALPSLRVAGLWQRLRYNKEQSILFAALMWPVLVVGAPMLRFLPADIGVQVFVRSSRQTAANCLELGDEEGPAHSVRETPGCASGEPLPNASVNVSRTESPLGGVTVSEVHHGHGKALQFDSDSQGHQ
jgi:SAM-dependent methyltransferase